MIDGHEYAVLNVYADTPVSTMEDFTYRNKYAKVVLQEDCCWEASYCVEPNTPRDGGSIIFDLHGHTFDTSKMGSFEFYIYYGDLEITDSSAAGTGAIKGNIQVSFIVNAVDDSFSAFNFTLNGGTIMNGITFFEDFAYSFLQEAGYIPDVNIRINDGKILGNKGVNLRYFDTLCGVNFLVNGGYVSSLGFEFYTPGWAMSAGPYISYDLGNQVDGDYTSVARNLHFAPFEKLPYDYYAVSTSDSFSGAYNYVYGYAWEKTADEMADLAVAADKIYYVWARNKDDWYHCLDFRYINGEIKSVTKV